ncbi:unnamed protein product [Diplocarpon coronariae]
MDFPNTKDPWYAINSKHAGSEDRYQSIEHIYQYAAASAPAYHILSAENKIMHEFDSR